MISKYNRIYMMPAKMADFNVDFVELRNRSYRFLSPARLPEPRILEIWLPPPGVAVGKRRMSQPIKYKGDNNGK